VGEEQKQRSSSLFIGVTWHKAKSSWCSCATHRPSSRFIGVSWHKANSSWVVKLWDPQTKPHRRSGPTGGAEAVQQLALHRCLLLEQGHVVMELRLWDSQIVMTRAAEGPTDHAPPPPHPY
jgi:hypothetical protein